MGSYLHKDFLFQLGFAKIVQSFYDDDGGDDDVCGGSDGHDYDGDYRHHHFVHHDDLHNGPFCDGD